MKRFILPFALSVFSLLLAACSDGSTQPHSTQPEHGGASPNIILRDLTPVEYRDVSVDRGLVLAPPGAVEYYYEANAQRLVLRHTEALFREGASRVSLRVDRQENILTIIEEQSAGNGMLRRYNLTAEIQDLPAGVYRVLVVEPNPQEGQLPLTFKLDLVGGNEGRFDRPQTAELASLSR